MQIILSLLYLVIFSLFIRFASFFQNIKGMSWKLLLIFFYLKVLSGVILISVYTYYYDLSIADFYKYFVDGNIMFSALRENPVDYLRMLTGIGINAGGTEPYLEAMSSWYRPWETPVYNDNRLVVRFNALVRLFSFGYIHVHNVFMNFLSFLGLVALYKFFIRYIHPSKLEWLPWGIFLFPGLLFWGSGILKEGLMIFAFGVWVYFVDKMTREFAYSSLIVLIISVFILVLLKPYNLIFFLPLQIAFYLGMHKNIWQKHIIYTTSVIAIVLLGLILSSVFPQYNVLEIIARKQNDFVNYTSEQGAGSLIHTRYIKPELWDMILFFPRGLFYVLTRPHIFEVYSPVVLMAALENLLVLFMMVFVFIKTDKKGFYNPVVHLSFWFIILILGFIGLVTPLHGAFVRYKILVLPFIWYVFISICRLPSYAKMIFLINPDKKNNKI